MVQLFYEDITASLGVRALDERAMPGPNYLSNARGAFTALTRDVGGSTDSTLLVLFPMQD